MLAGALCDETAQVTLRSPFREKSPISFVRWGQTSHGRFAKLGVVDHAVAVGLMPGLALLSARPIARLLHRVLWPRPEAAHQVPFCLISSK